MAASVVALPAGEVADEVRYLVRLVDEARDRGEVEALVEVVDGLLPAVEVLPAGRTEVERKAYARAVSGVKTARIHLRRAGLEVPLARGLVLASQALTDAAENVEVLA